MDFLETDFHKRKTPKRSVKLKNSDNLLIGLNLAKYPDFEREIHAMIGQSFQKGSAAKIVKGVYRTNLPRNLLEVVKLQAGKIHPSSVNDVISSIAEEIEKLAVLHKKEHDKAISTSFEFTARQIKDTLVLPFVSSIEKPIESLGIGDENEVFLVEEELTDILSKLIENKVSEIVNRTIAEDKTNAKKELKAVFEIEDIKKSITSYFESLQVGDLFNEVYEISKNQAILDKQDFYLYLGEITFSKNKYPIFYIPISVDAAGDTLTLTFEPQIYINKRALEYIVQEYNTQKDARGNLKTITDRIIYLSHHSDDLPGFLNKILDEIGNLFQLDKNINLRDDSAQVGRSLLVRVSNVAHIALFDKSDEALINDYEEILQQINSESGELAELFNELVDDFIHKNPVSFNPEVENEWDESDVASKLVFSSPIPLNGEQRQILSALRKKDCKYVIVEGPPGTGKSHTITAISFDAILQNQSVLILSDKKEALDVVEDKLTETMDKVRSSDGEEDFQNPILRLGKTGSTYNKILSRPTLEKIKTHHRAVKKNIPELEGTIDKLQNSLKEDIEAEILLYGEVDLAHIHDYCDVEASYEGRSFPFDYAEITANPKRMEFIEAFRAFLQGVTQQFSENPTAKLLRVTPEHFSTPEALKSALGYVALMNVAVSGVGKRMGNKVDAALEYQVFSEASLPTLKKFVERYQAKKFPVFGYLFSRSSVASIDAEFKVAFPFAPYTRPSHELQKIGDAIEMFDHLLSLKAQGKAIALDGMDCLTSGLELLVNAKDISEFSTYAGQLAQELGKMQAGIPRLPKTHQLLGIVPTRLDTWLSNKLTEMTDEDFERACAMVSLKDSLEKSFRVIPQVNYAHQKKEIETLVTTKVTHLLDTRLVDFYTHNQNDASTLRDVIKDKRRFPKEQFTKLKDAFPCILAGIRDYAEYIPLEAGLFDLVIIDEASQVSIAQAFPALIRAKKVLILGDRKQFSNVKSAQARSETNTEYKNTLATVFRKEISTEDSKLVKLRKFDIKTSILEFFESISNYQTQLLKHFRGYRELIGYSNKHFYLESLQVMKIRGKKIDEVIKFSYVKPAEAEIISNTNRKEIERIIHELCAIKESNQEPSVGIITPHTNQQKLLMEEISKLPDEDFFFNKLKLKIMTFDTCQGEERDIIFYSMVATEYSDKLWGVFIKNLASVDSEEDGKIKVQRLNVGFSRAKECVHFMLSKPLDKFDGSIGDALRYFHNTLEEGRKEKTAAAVDERSQMEPQVLNWFYQTKFWTTHKEQINFQPQFEIGKYLKQLDRTYQHANYKVDFLIVYRDTTHREHKIIIEYDGFQEHFKEADGVNAFNFKHYYSEDDIYRQKILEGYGYKFIRINKFNAGKNPITTLDARICALLTTAEPTNHFLDEVHETIEGLENGNKKECPRCKEIRDIEDFRDGTLVSGMGRFCRQCKQNKVLAPVVPRPRTVVPGIACLRCGSPMALRVGKYGRFYGCSTFPRCKGTRKI